MSRFGFVGPTYASQSPNADAQRCVNLYPEVIESQMGKGAMALYPTPGLSLFAKLPGGSVPGAFTINGRKFFISGPQFFEVGDDGNVTARGAIAPQNTPVKIVSNGQQIFFVSGGLPYCFNLSKNVFQDVQPLAQPNPIKAEFCDGYFIVLFANSQEFQISGLEDGTQWDATDVFEVSVFPDNVLSILVDHREVWLWGGKETQVYFDSGNALAPFSPIPGGFIEQGILAPDSPVRLDNSVFWLGGDERGGGIAWRAQGYTPARISNHAVEFVWSTYPTLKDVQGYAYQDQGHSFWVLRFPSANTTWVYDVATGMWAERSYLEANGTWTAHRSMSHIFDGTRHLVGDWATGNVYQMSIAYLTDNGNPIPRMRRAPHISTEQEWIYHNQLQVDLEVGLAGVPALTIPSTLPTFAQIEDSLGNLWFVTILDNGAVQTNGGQAGVAPAVYINDQTGMTTWQLGVVASGATKGELKLTAVTYQPSAPTSIPLATAGVQLECGIQVTGGRLQTLIPTQLYRAPQIRLRWSDDSAKTWSNEHWLDCGLVGQYKLRVTWRRLGRSRDRIYEIQWTDAVPLRVIDAYLKAAPGFQPQERMVKQLGKVT